MEPVAAFMGGVLIAYLISLIVLLVIIYYVIVNLRRESPKNILPLQLIFLLLFITGWLLLYGSKLSPAILYGVIISFVIFIIVRKNRLSSLFSMLGFLVLLFSAFAGYGMFSVNSTGSLNNTFYYFDNFNKLEALNFQSWAYYGIYVITACLLATALAVYFKKISFLPKKFTYLFLSASIIIFMIGITRDIYTYNNKIIETSSNKEIEIQNKKFLYSFDEDLWVTDLHATFQPINLTNFSSEEKTSLDKIDRYALSPDGNMAAYEKGDTVYLIDISSNTKKPLFVLDDEKDSIGSISLSDSMIAFVINKSLSPVPKIESYVKILDKEGQTLTTFDNGLNPLWQGKDLVAIKQGNNETEIYVIEGGIGEPRKVGVGKSLHSQIRTIFLQEGSSKLIYEQFLNRNLTFISVDLISGNTEEVKLSNKLNGADQISPDMQKYIKADLRNHNDYLVSFDKKTNVDLGKINGKVSWLPGSQGVIIKNINNIVVADLAGNKRTISK